MLQDRKEEIRDIAFSRTIKELKAQKIRSYRKDNGVLGTYKNEPFCVYMSFIQDDSGELTGIITTRYKGKDVGMVEPLKVLNGG